MNTDDDSRGTWWPFDDGAVIVAAAWRLLPFRNSEGDIFAAEKEFPFRNLLKGVVVFKCFSCSSIKASSAESVSLEYDGDIGGCGEFDFTSGWMDEDVDEVKASLELLRLVLYGDMARGKSSFVGNA